MEKKTIIFRKGNKVILRPVLEEDLHLFQVWMNDPDVTQYVRRVLPASLEDERAWMTRVSKTTSENVTLAIVDVETNELIGSMGLHNINYIDGTAKTGSLIGNKDYWGKGYGSEAKMLLLEFAFNELNLRKIYSDVIAYNKRSLAYANKCGYVEEARIPKHYFKKGKYWDQVILAVYRTPWEKIWKKYSKENKLKK